MLVAGSDGALAGDVRPLVRLNVTVIVEQGGRREQGSGGGGGRVGYGWFLDEDRAGVMRGRRCGRRWSIWTRSPRWWGR